MKKVVLIVGASGVGKDSLIKAVQNKIEANFVKRYITRMPDNNESNFYLDDEAFENLKHTNFFVSSWEAHNNKYAIAHSHIKEGLNIISISRGAIKDFEKVFENCITINITVDEEILKQRLLNRGRESLEQIEKRIQRVNMEINAKNLITFDNSKELKVTSLNFIELLQSLIWE